MNNITEELKDRIDIVELISRYVHLKRRGANYFGLCPFHSEKTPSFSVNPKGKFFHCFGCGASGDAITFYMKIENLEFKDAIRELAQQYGVDINFQKESNPLIEIHKIAADFFHSAIKNSKTAMNYLEHRKINRTIADNFLIGYAPANSTLYGKLREKFDEAQIIGSGIFVNGTNGVYNRFTNRIIFPIKDASGNTIAFGGRILGNNKDKAKYLNSPETKLFSKHRVLYGLDVARKYVRDVGYFIVTEGYMDCLRLYNSGFQTAVATLGTALSKYHLSAIKRYTDKIYLNYDSDKAGFSAMMRSAPTIFSSGVNAYVVILDEDDDPDSFILKHKKGAYEERLKNAVEYFSYIINFLKNRYNMDNPQEKINALNEIKPIINMISDPMKKAAYISKIARIFNISENILTGGRKRIQNRQTDKKLTKEEALLSYLLKDIELFVWVENPDDFTEYFNGIYGKIYKCLLSRYMSGEQFELQEFLENFNDDEHEFVYRLLSEDSTEMEERHERRKSFLYLLNQFEIQSIKKKIKNIQTENFKSNSDDMIQGVNKLFSRLQELKNA